MTAMIFNAHLMPHLLCYAAHQPAYPDPEYKVWPVLGNTTYRVDTLYVYIYLHMLSNQAISTCSQNFLSVFWSTGGLKTMHLTAISHMLP